MRIEFDDDQVAHIMELHFEDKRLLRSFEIKILRICLDSHFFSSYDAGPYFR